MQRCNYPANDTELRASSECHTIGPPLPHGQWRMTCSSASYFSKAACCQCCGEQRSLTEQQSGGERHMYFRPTAWLGAQQNGGTGPHEKGRATWRLPRPRGTLDHCFFFFCCTAQLAGFSSPTRDQTHVLRSENTSPNHWAARGSRLGSLPFESRAANEQ